MLMLAKLPSGVSHSQERPRNKAGVKPFIVAYYECSFSRSDIFNMLTQQYVTANTVILSRPYLKEYSRFSRS